MGSKVVFNSIFEIILKEKFMKEDTYDVEISLVVAKTRGQYCGASYIVFCLVGYQLNFITFFGIEDD